MARIFLLERNCRRGDRFGGVVISLIGMSCGLCLSTKLTTRGRYASVYMGMDNEARV